MFRHIPRVTYTTKSTKHSYFEGPNHKFGLVQSLKGRSGLAVFCKRSDRQLRHEHQFLCAAMVRLAVTKGNAKCCLCGLTRKAGLKSISKESAIQLYEKHRILVRPGV